MKSIAGALFVFTSALFQSAYSDVLILRNGQVIHGTVLQNEHKGVLFQREYGTLTYPKDAIKEVQEEDGTAITGASLDEHTIPRWGNIISLLAKQKWASELKQIPATVIDKGILKNVPYISFQAAYGYEMNIYGDLDKPAGFEIGVRGYLLERESARSNCIAFVGSVLPNEKHSEMVRKLKWEKDLIVQDGLTFEITPPSAPDAYGGWWVSIYDESALERARVSDKELMEISQQTTYQSRTLPVLSPKAVSQKRNVSANQDHNYWSANEINSVRLSKPIPTHTGGSERVYVRGYYRKDGTFVRGYTRRAPKR